MKSDFHHVPCEIPLKCLLCSILKQFSRLHYFTHGNFITGLKMAQCKCRLPPFLCFNLNKYKLLQFIIPVPKLRVCRQFAHSLELNACLKLILFTHSSVHLSVNPPSVHASNHDLSIINLMAFRWKMKVFTNVSMLFPFFRSSIHHGGYQKILFVS